MAIKSGQISITAKAIQQAQKKMMKIPTLVFFQRNSVTASKTYGHLQKKWAKEKITRG